MKEHHGRFNRRDALRALLAAGFAPAWPRLALAATGGDARFVLIVLRGALDGLALAPPWGDPNYERMRAGLAFAAPGQSGGVLPLTDLFGLHPSMSNVHGWYRSRQALVFHAVASPYRARSHFDGQDVLEGGGVRQRDGWLNRALAFAPEAPSTVALSHTVPLVLRGTQPVTSWSPARLPDASDDTLRRLALLYEDDPFFAAQFDEAMAARAIARRTDTDKGRRERYGFADTMARAAAFLSDADGARIAVVDADGWDTHARQGVTTGALASRLGALDDGLKSLRDGLGAHWDRTVVAVVTEFGRTVRPNGTQGTDHGTASAALLVGGAVTGGRVIADWPGLGERALYQGRDLAATRDLRSLFKSVLVAHLGLDDAAVARHVFADSRAAPVHPEWFV